MYQYPGMWTKRLTNCKIHKGLQNPKRMSDCGDDDDFDPNCYSKFLSITFYLPKLTSAALYALFSLWPVLAQSFQCCCEVHPPHPTWDQGGGVCLLMSSTSAQPEGSSRTVFWERVTVKWWELQAQMGVLFHLLKSCTIICRYYIFWYGSHYCLLAKQKQKVVSEYFLFKSPVKVSLRICLQCSISVVRMAIE